MNPSSASWQILPNPMSPAWFTQAVAKLTQETDCHFTATLLWQRGIHTSEALASFLDPARYQPSSPLSFGVEMQRAVERLQQAQANQEKVLIWGDFDADGLTATAVLWEGLGRIFPQGDRLGYYVPHRFTESHGLSYAGLDRVRSEGYHLIVTCDTGCSQIQEIAYARSLGFDVIVTDHHTLPTVQPPAVAVINPRQLPRDHPLANLSGVAVAYKLLEALYSALNLPAEDLQQLLDLVAIGLIADLVELTGECRYLAQRGLSQLNPQNQSHFRRPGLVALLENCKRNGDRPTDISFGLAPRINAVSRIHGDARFVIELLTSQDTAIAEKLAEEAELANTRRKGLQQQVLKDVKALLSRVDLSSQSMIVLYDPQWPIGLLGLVAGQIAQDYQRPTLLLSTTQPEDLEEDSTQNPEMPLARGSARSVAGVDLYQLIESQQHLLSGFGGHPLALGLSLPPNNIPLLSEALNRQLKVMAFSLPPSNLVGDVTITVAHLLKEEGKALFRQLRWLEPFGMGNPVPRLYVNNCWFKNVKEYKSLEDLRKQKTAFVRTEFELWDETASQGFTGVWWGHAQADLPNGRCDAIVELDFQPHSGKLSRRGKLNPRYQIRLISVRQSHESDHANNDPEPTFSGPNPEPHRLEPSASLGDRDRFSGIDAASPIELWQKWLGLAKYLSRTQEQVSRDRLRAALGVSDRTLSIGLKCLERLGFQIVYSPKMLDDLPIQILPGKFDSSSMQVTTQAFMNAVKEETFRKQYFWQAPP